MENNEEKIEKVNAEKKQFQFTLTSELLYLLLPLVALTIFVVYKMVVGFGVYNRVVHGIISIFVYGFAFSGMLVPIFRGKKPSYDFWFSAGVLGLALMVL